MYDAIKSASGEARTEIADIYFGHSFNYYHNGRLFRYGDVMGVEASPDQLTNLFRIQDDFGVPISLTLNSPDAHPALLLDKHVREFFLGYLRRFYERGLRSCTISHVHLMASGILQEHFPEMHWKNTVNQLVATAQGVADYAALGYDTILLDRSLNRNFDELKRSKKVAGLKGVRTSLLISEGCLPACPFKTEHGLVQADFQQTPEFDYWTVMGDLSCNRWRTDVVRMPRSGTDMVAPTRDILDGLLESVDVFKFSGRISHLAPGIPYRPRFGWEFQKCFSEFEDTVMFDSFGEIYDGNLEPFNAWMPIAYDAGTSKVTSSDAAYRAAVAASDFARVWLSPEGKHLARVLMTCRNQCWDCHLCERVFGYKDIDSLLEMRRPAGQISK